MSETFEPNYTPTAEPTRPTAVLSPQLFMGAVSPLWGYYGAAIAGGMALWWMRQWVGAPKNLEAMLGSGASVPPPSFEPAPPRVISAPESEEPVGFALVDTIAETLAAESEPQPVDDPAETPPEPVFDPTPEPGPDTLPEPEEEPMRMDAPMKAGKRHTPKMPEPDAG